MGMYDYLGGEQIKIFYSPIFDEGKGAMLSNKPNTWHSGGLLRSFGKNDRLPLETLYYKYPKRFIVFDYRNGNRYPAWIIKGGRFNKLKRIKDFSDGNLYMRVFDYYGKELNIKTKKDFFDIYNGVNLAEIQRKNVEKKFFGDKNVFDVIKNDSEYFKSVENEYYKELDSMNGNFSDRWYVKDKYQLEKQFGEFLDCYLDAKIFKDGKISDWDNPMQRYLNCKEALKNFVKENNNIVDKYFKWLGWQNKDLYNVIEDLKNDLYVENK